MKASPGFSQLPTKARSRLLLFVLVAGLATFGPEISSADRNRGVQAKRPVVLPPSTTVQKQVPPPVGQTLSRPATGLPPTTPPRIPLKEDTFNHPTTTFSTPPGSFSTPPGSFNRPATTFQTPTGTFSRPESTFSTPTGSFSRPASTFSNPTQATSPLPPGAYRAPIRPPSTFALPPGGTTFSRPTTIFPGAVVTEVYPIDATTPQPLDDSSVGGFAPVQTGQEEQSATAVAPAPPPVVIDLPPGAVIRKVAPPAAVQPKK